MKKIFLTVAAIAMVGVASAQQKWAPAGELIKTEWAAKVDPANVLPEYPRPQMTRSEWVNLNGLWDYAIRPMGETQPTEADGKILVPFCVESSLSGVMKTFTEKDELWYTRTFTVPSSWKNRSVILNFGGVDWKADVFLNDVLIGTHTGCYVPFSFDVTPYLKAKGEQKLTVRVWDPTNRGYQPRGKQEFNGTGIWYTPVSGIWQTVWMEPVSKAHITGIKAVPAIDNVTVTVSAEGTEAGDYAEISIMDAGKVIASAKALPGTAVILPVKGVKLWSPDSPTLYDMNVQLVRGGKAIDKVGSYTAFRSIGIVNQGGVKRMTLNGKPMFHFGPLDQGWWPDGLYTAPTDEALVYDIVKTKEWGFNMIRKHIKVEPARWFYHCDKLGILVWQDMPSGDGGSRWDAGAFNGGTDAPRSQASKDNYYKEWEEIMDFCVSFPSVVVWVPFNEAWGQFDTEKVAAWTKAYDPSRLVNPASGGNHRFCGDILDLHHYPAPAMNLYNGQKVNVLGEYGGIGLRLEDHLWWKDKRNWGYVQYNNAKEVTDEYVKFTKILETLTVRGFSGAVYTQTTDVEGEVNGLMTYDRKVIKIDEARVAAANKAVIDLVK